VIHRFIHDHAFRQQLRQNPQQTLNNHGYMLAQAEYETLTALLQNHTTQTWRELSDMPDVGWFVPFELTSAES
jgi:hypothetical protein